MRTHAGVTHARCATAAQTLLAALDKHAAMQRACLHRAAVAHAKRFDDAIELARVQAEQLRSQSDALRRGFSNGLPDSSMVPPDYAVVRMPLVSMHVAQMEWAFVIGQTVCAAKTQMAAPATFVVDTVTRFYMYVDLRDEANAVIPHVQDFSLHIVGAASYMDLNVCEQPACAFSIPGQTFGYCVSVVFITAPPEHTEVLVSLHAYGTPLRTWRIIETPPLCPTLPDEQYICHTAHALEDFGTGGDWFATVYTEAEDFVQVIVQGIAPDGTNHDPDYTLRPLFEFWLSRPAVVTGVHVSATDTIWIVFDTDVQEYSIVGTLLRQYAAPNPHYRHERMASSKHALAVLCTDFVSNATRLLLLDTRTDKLRADVPLPDLLEHMQFSADGAKLYALHASDKAVLVLSPHDGAVLLRVNTGATHPRAFLVSAHEEIVLFDDSDRYTTLRTLTMQGHHTDQHRLGAYPLRMRMCADSIPGYSGTLFLMYDNGPDAVMIHQLRR